MHTGKSEAALRNAPLNGLNFFDALHARHVGKRGIYNYLIALSVDGWRSVLNAEAS